MKCPKCGSVKFYGLPCVSVEINSNGKLIHNTKYINDCDSIELIVCSECDCEIEGVELQEWIDETRKKQNKKVNTNNFWD